MLWKIIKNYCRVLRFNAYDAVVDAATDAAGNIIDNFKNGWNAFRAELKIDVPSLESITGKGSYEAFTNPIWLNFGVEDEEEETIEAVGQGGEFELFNLTEHTPYELAYHTLAADENRSFDIVTGSVNYIGAPSASSFFPAVDFGNVDGQPLALNNPGILLTSGDGSPPLENTSNSFGINHGNPGYGPLEEILEVVYDGTTSTYDAAVLEFTIDVDPGVSSDHHIAFDLLFGSEEYPNFIDSYVDIAGVFVNNKNYADFAFESIDPGIEPDELRPLSVLSRNVDDGYFIDNMNAGLNIEYNGISSPLTVRAPVEPGENTITLAIADTRDHIYDSGLFVSNIRDSLATGGGVSQVINVSEDPLELDSLSTIDVIDNPLIDAIVNHLGLGTAIFEGKGGNNTFNVEGNGSSQFFGGIGNDTFNVLNPSPWNAPQSIDLSAGGDNYVSTGGNNDSVISGPGNDEITIGGGYDIISGKAEDLDGDIINGFNANHLLQMFNVIPQQLQNLIVEPGSAHLKADTNEDGEIDTSLYLTGDFNLEEGSFSVKSDGNGGSYIQYQDPIGDGTDARSHANETLIPVNANNSYFGGGGNNRYEIHDGIQQPVRLVDAEGENEIYINDSLVFDQVKFSRSGVMFDLEGDGSVRVLGDMDSFVFVFGGNVRTGAKDLTTDFEGMADHMVVDIPEDTSVVDAGSWEVDLAGVSEDDLDGLPLFAA